MKTICFDLFLIYDGNEFSLSQNEKHCYFSIKADMVFETKMLTNALDLYTKIPVSNS